MPPDPEPLALRVDELLLRSWRPDDVAAVHAACQDPAIPRWTRIPSPYTWRDAEEWVLETAPHLWATGRGAHTAVTEAASGGLLGAVGLAPLDAPHGRAEIGYWLTARARGRGVATRATRALASWGLRTRHLHRVELFADVRNLASRRVAERAGFRFEGVARRYEDSGAGRGDAAVYSMVTTDLPGRPTRPGTPS